VSNLSQSLKDAVKRLAYGASLDQLKKRGIQKVNVLGIDRIVALIEEAVNRSLKHKLMGLERSVVADRTKEEFLKLLKSNEELEKSRDELAQMQQRAQEEIDEVRQQLAQQKAALAERLGVAHEQESRRYQGENAAIARELDALFRQFVQLGKTDVGTLRDGVVALVRKVVDAERQTALAALAAARDREVEILERRIGKMTDALEQNEQRMAEVLAMKDVDSGVASVYREVQGLNSSARSYQKKKELMSEIFKANLALQKGIQEE
jgi:hypothetical protein